MINRIYIVIRGAVQGVGFRPFIYRLATEYNLKGFVLNSSAGLFIEVEGENKFLNEFLVMIEKEKPSRAIINSMEFLFLDPVGYETFEIRESSNEEDFTTLILPDIAVCDDCLNELFDPENRRYLYPFINCTNCGPRFSIIESLPYDRPNTSMKIFNMCKQCRDEYENPLDRRFHAQPIACADCGPHVELWDKNGKSISQDQNAINQTVEMIADGKIIAVKGLGGFHLVVDASNDKSVSELRARKNREEKPLALMFTNIESVKKYCEVSKLEERALCSAESPIVILKRKNIFTKISQLVAPENPYFGIMLPYTPLHHILMRLFGEPIIATSGNLSEEPMCIDEYEALSRLKGIADYFLVHNRPILRHVDDSIVRIIGQRELVLRRARGYAPLPITIELESKCNKGDFIAVGGQLKNTIALVNSKNIFVSQHIGDLSTNESYNAFTKIVADFKKLYKTNNNLFVHDLHPDYISTKYAKNYKSIGIQHHQAHIASCYAENRLQGTVLGVSWDGTGYGLDGKIWGGEFFLTDGVDYKRVATFREFPLPGGELAIREPRRTALAIVYKIGEDFLEKYKKIFEKCFSSNEYATILQMLRKNINCPKTTSAGRLFDAVAAIIGIRQVSNYEGQAAMMLEYTASRVESADRYDIVFKQNDLITIDWELAIKNILESIKSVPNELIARKFHNTMAYAIVEIANRIGEDRVLLSGGCFQNSILLDTTIKSLIASGKKVYWHQRIPPNDGGISLGQAYIALNKYFEKNEKG